jgi:hypothetical protein
VARRRLILIVAFAAIAFSFAYPVQVNGWNQNAHYALVRALADGTPSIDKSRTEIGDLGTGDVTLVDGHYYSNKAPGLAFVSLPAFYVLEAIGMRTTGDPTHVIWALHLWSVAMPALLLVALARFVADELEPGYGLAAAVTLALGTLVLPFAGLFFAHVLSAAFGFAAFALLVYERREGPRPWLVAGAGLLGGLAATTEYTVGFAAVVIGVYAALGEDRLRRALLYGGGLLAGLLPLALYNTWAFGSPTHLSYEENQVEPIGGILGFGLPSPRAFFDLLFSAWGLVTTTPVLVLGVVGGVLLVRSRSREALVLLAVPAIGLLHDSALQFSPFGGLGLPRYLIYTLPFVAVGLAAAYRRFPVTTCALALASVFQMVVMTATNPLAAYDLDWIGRLSRRQFSEPGSWVVGVTGWYAILPLFAAVAVALVAAAVATPSPRIRTNDCAAAAVALAVWAVIAVVAETPDGGRLRFSYVVALAFAAGAAVGSGALALSLSGPAGRERAAVRPAG